MVRKQLRGWLRNKDMQTAFNRITSHGIVGIFQKTMLHERPIFARMQEDTYYLE